MNAKTAKDQAAEQLSMFAIKPTANIRNQSPGQVMLEVLEISSPTKESLQKYDNIR